MNKIKYDLIRKIYADVTLTSDELSMLIYLAKNCNDYGDVFGVYYRECAKELSFSNAQFYNITKSLEIKGYIIKKKEHISDVNICLWENNFVEPGEDYCPVVVYKDYLNLNMQIFNDKSFYDLKVGAKKLAIALVVKAINDKARRKKSGGKTYAKIFHIPINEYHIYADKFKVSKRMIREYYKDIEKWITTYTDGSHTGKEIITVKQSAIDKPTIVVSQKGKRVITKKTDAFDGDLSYIKMFCRRNEIEVNSESLTDTAVLATQYRKKAAELGQAIWSVVERAISSIGNVLSAAGVNKYISNYLANYKEPEPEEPAPAGI